MPETPDAPSLVLSSRYQAYLLRLWRDRAPGAPWHASLEFPGGEAVLRFGNVEDLFAFLRQQVGGPAPESEKEMEEPHP